ncbi:hypothetical protein CTA1_7136 [Colletotrichum tanaceti]|uniref:Uncharacterized protein n=1 Tax=Colletotrichum tanaceti TaxID=1306861 RepID=A0A4U6XU15_9PEZI|nr:hypothetical protein CTA1_7136 [Colletotrichum tanaceti]
MDERCPSSGRVISEAPVRQIDMPRDLETLRRRRAISADSDDNEESKQQKERPRQRGLIGETAEHRRRRRRRLEADLQSDGVFGLWPGWCAHDPLRIPLAFDGLQ